MVPDYTDFVKFSGDILNLICKMWKISELIGKNILKRLYQSEGIIHFNLPAKVRRVPHANDEGVLTPEKGSKQLAAAFSKPPMPPLLGPFFIFSILEMSLHTDRKNE
ncbi:hypothetical protein SUGI_0024100 [Cryptomeria japonica]|nr:hypothetical protein SUGI_0024100 [Cryptomeria japonica]